LKSGGRFFVSELHPNRQYQGSQARFVDAAGSTIMVRAYAHHVSDLVSSAIEAGFVIERLDEWWHAQDTQKAPDC